MTAVSVLRRRDPLRWLGFAGFLIVTVALMLPVIIIVLTAIDTATQKAMAGGNPKDLLKQAQSDIQAALEK